MKKKVIGKDFDQIKPSRIQGRIVIAGKSVSISTATVSGTVGASSEIIIKGLKRAVKQGVFPESPLPVFP